MITTAARRIARAVNKDGRGYGKMAFDLDGSGGYWYADNCYGFSDGSVVVYLSSRKMTYAQAQALLDSVLEEEAA